jgi:hypothetical protein
MWMVGLIAALAAAPTLVVQNGHGAGKLATGSHRIGVTDDGVVWTLMRDTLVFWHAETGLQLESVRPPCGWAVVDASDPSGPHFTCPDSREAGSFTTVRYDRGRGAFVPGVAGRRFTSSVEDPDCRWLDAVGIAEGAWLDRSPLGLHRERDGERRGLGAPEDVWWRGAAVGADGAVAALGRPAAFSRSDAPPRSARHDADDWAELRSCTGAPRHYAFAATSDRALVWVRDGRRTASHEVPGHALDAAHWRLRVRVPSGSNIGEDAVGLVVGGVGRDRVVSWTTVNGSVGFLRRGEVEALPLGERASVVPRAASATHLVSAEVDAGVLVTDVVDGVVRCRIPTRTGVVAAALDDTRAYALLSDASWVAWSVDDCAETARGESRTRATYVTADADGFLTSARPTDGWEHEAYHLFPRSRHASPAGGVELWSSGRATPVRLGEDGEALLARRDGAYALVALSTGDVRIVDALGREQSALPAQVPGKATARAWGHLADGRLRWHGVPNRHEGADFLGGEAPVGRGSDALPDWLTPVGWYGPERRQLWWRTWRNDPRPAPESIEALLERLEGDLLTPVDPSEWEAELVDPDTLEAIPLPGPVVDHLAGMDVRRVHHTADGRWWVACEGAERLVFAADGTRHALSRTDDYAGHDCGLLHGTGLLVAREFDELVVHDLDGDTPVARRTLGLGAAPALEIDPAGRWVSLSTAQDGAVFYSTETWEPVLRLFRFAGGRWAAVGPAGRFDGSDGGRVEGLHFVVDDEPVALEQLAARYYEPGLVPRVLRDGGRGLQDLGGLRLDLPPSLELLDAPTPASPVLRFAVEERGGGIGPLAVRVDGREVLADVPTRRGARGSRVVEVSMASLGALEPGVAATVRVLPSNAEGYLQGRGLAVSWTPPGEASERPPTLHAVVVGVSDYRGDALDLRYAHRDASAFSDALSTAAGGLFGDRVRVTTLTDPGGVGRDAVLGAVRAAAEAADYGDVLVLFLAGHGTAVSTGEAEEFFFLTSEAEGFAVDDRPLLEATSVSGTALREALGASRAKRQLLVLDACGSGAMDGARSGDTRARTRALRTLEDRSGVYLLAGAAADAASYESPRLGHGLLTAALLDALHVDGVDQDGTLYVDGWIRAAGELASELAVEEGRHQQPQVRMPLDVGSFPVGLLDAERRARLPRATSRVLLQRPAVTGVASTGFIDTLGVGGALERRLRDLSETSPFVVLSSEHGQAWSLSVQVTPGPPHRADLGLRAPDGTVVVERVAAATVDGLVEAITSAWLARLP